VNLPEDEEVCFVGDLIVDFVLVSMFVVNDCEIVVCVVSTREFDVIGSDAIVVVVVVVVIGVVVLVDIVSAVGRTVAIFVVVVGC
jgi:hypothetical protein